MDFNGAFSAQVRIEMIPRGFRQRELAAASSLTAKALSNRLTGETEWDGSAMASVAAGLGLKLSVLIARAEDLLAVESSAAAVDGPAPATSQRSVA